MDSSNIAYNQENFQSLLNKYVKDIKPEELNKKNKPENNNSTPETSEELVNIPILEELGMILNAIQINDEDYKKITDTINMLSEIDIEPDQVIKLIQSLSAKDNGDLIYTRTSQFDPFLNFLNKIPLTGADLKDFIKQINLVNQKGQNVEKYLDTVIAIVKNSDYDDLRYFIDTTNTALDSNNNLNSFLDKSTDIALNDNSNLEMYSFSITSLLERGVNLEIATNILEDMNVNGSDGRENMSRLNHLLVKSEEKNDDTNSLINQLYLSDDSLGFINNWFSENGITIVSLLEHNRFDRIESIVEQDDLVMNVGEKVAIFARAISSTEGVLPEDVLYWSSKETGAMMHGDDHLDLSYLDPGVYDIYVKVGPGYGGTDTAKKRVIVKDENGEIPETNGNYNFIQEEVMISGGSYSNSRSNVKQDRLKDFKRLYNEFAKQNKKHRFLDENDKINKFVDIFNSFSEDFDSFLIWTEKLLDAMDKSEEFRLDSLKAFRKFMQKKLHEDYRIARNEKIKEVNQQSIKDYDIKVQQNLEYQNTKVIIS